MDHCLKREGQLVIQMICIINMVNFLICNSSNSHPQEEYRGSDYGASNPLINDCDKEKLSNDSLNYTFSDFWLIAVRLI